MSQDVLHFQCTACHTPLTVPVSLAGVTGPCPKCGATVTSPAAPPPEPLLVPPMPAMTPPSGYPQPPATPTMPPMHQPPMMQQPAPPPAPPAPPPPAPPPPLVQQSLFPPVQPQAQAQAPQPPAPPAAAAGAGAWGSIGSLPPLQNPVAQMQPPAAQAPVMDPAADAAGSSLLPPRRAPGQMPASSSLMNQPAGGGFGPTVGGLPGPSSPPAWSLAGQPAPAQIPAREPEDPMTAILRGTGGAPQIGSELDSDPRDLKAAAAQFPTQATAPAPVTMPKQTMDIRLGGKKKNGKLIGALAAVLILGAIGGAAWHFQEPIREMAQNYMRSKSKGDVPSDNANSEAPPAEPADSKSKSEPQGSDTVVKKAEPDSTPGNAFDPTSKSPSANTPSSTPPIVLENSSPSTPTSTTPAIAPGAASSILGVTPPANSAQPTEVKAAMRPGEEPAPKAAIVEDTPPKGDPAKPQHVPGTALSKMEPPTTNLVEVTPAKTPPSSAPTVVSDSPLSPKVSDDPQEVNLQDSPEGKKAAESLKAFFAAKNLDERLPLTLGADSMKSLMERYYAKKDSGPIAVDEIKLLRHDPHPATGGGAHCVFTVASKQWDYPIPVMLQEEGDTYKVDWISFVEFRDNLLFEFLSSYQDVPARFHVGIRRTHYFEDDVPDLDQKDCFEIQPPVPTYVGYVFVPKGTPLAADLTTRIGWETMTAYVIVELRWKREGDRKWVELTGVPQYNWYSLPQATPTAKPAPAPKNGGVDIKKKK